MNFSINKGYLPAFIIAIVLSAMGTLCLIKQGIEYKKLETENNKLRENYASLMQYYRDPIIMPIGSDSFMIIFSKELLKGHPIDKEHLNNQVRMILWTEKGKKEVSTVISSSNHFSFVCSEKEMNKCAHIGLEVFWKENWHPILSR